MYRKCSLILLLVGINIKVMMAQSIGLSNLLDFQQRQNPGYIANFLTSAGGWITDYSDFQNAKADYKWFKANAGEEFEPHTKDQLAYTSPLQSYKSAITYVTLTKSNFDNIKASMQSTLTLDGMLINDPKVKMYKYSNSTVVMEVIEPLQAQRDNLFMYVFIVYDKKDYINGFRIK
jgi:hypothetical protein